MLKETTEHAKANATLRDEDDHLLRVSACSRWKTMNSGRLGCRGIPLECKDFQAVSRQSQGKGNGGIWTCIYRVARGLDVVGWRHGRCMAQIQTEWDVMGNRFWMEVWIVLMQCGAPVDP